jgi:hypothetical protein
MLTKIQYYTDDSGRKTSVIIPYSKWEDMNKQLEELQIKLQLFQSIQDGISEVKKAQNSGKNLQTLSDFIHESRG